MQTEQNEQPASTVVVATWIVIVTLTMIIIAAYAAVVIVDHLEYRRDFRVESPIKHEPELDPDPVIAYRSEASIPFPYDTSIDSILRDAMHRGIDIDTLITGRPTIRAPRPRPPLLPASPGPRLEQWVFVDSYHSYPPSIEWLGYFTADEEVDSRLTELLEYAQAQGINLDDLAMTTAAITLLCQSSDPPTPADLVEHARAHGVNLNARTLQEATYYCPDVHDFPAQSEPGGTRRASATAVAQADDDPR